MQGAKYCLPLTIFSRYLAVLSPLSHDESICSSFVGCYFTLDFLVSYDSLEESFIPSKQNLFLLVWFSR